MFHKLNQTNYIHHVISPQFDYFDLDTETWSSQEDSEAQNSTKYLSLLMVREAIYRWAELEHFPNIYIQMTLSLFRKPTA